jgi:hypothetical protein
MGYPWFYWPSALMMNRGDETFSNRAAEVGIEPPPDGRHLELTIKDKLAARSSRCAATGDLNGDGRLDLVVNNFNDRCYYYLNEFPRRNFIALRLVGTKSNHNAIGAVVRMYVAGKILTRQVQPAGGYLSQSSRTLHFGLGDHDEIDRIEIHWPSGTRQTLAALEINALHEIVEPEGEGR